MIAANRKSSFGEYTFCCQEKDAVISRIELSFRAGGEAADLRSKVAALICCPCVSSDEREAPAEDIRVDRGEYWEVDVGGIRLRRDIRTKRLSIGSFER